MPEYEGREPEDGEYERLEVNIAPDTAQQIRDMLERKRLIIDTFTATDAVRRSFAVMSMIDAFIPDGGRIIIRDDDGNEEHLVIV